MKREWSEEHKAQWLQQRKLELEEFKKKIEGITADYQENPEHIAELLQFGSQFYHYSCKNTMLIQLQNPSATFVQSFTKWKDAGYPVKKNEKGVSIFRPVETVILDTEHGRVSLSKATEAQKDAYRKGELKSMKGVTFTLESVFDISQTLCPVEEYPRFYHMGHNDKNCKEFMDGLETYAQEHLQTIVSNVDVKSISLRGRAYMQRRSDEYWHIELNDKLKDTERLSTLTHEIGHQVMHRNMPNKPTELIEVESDCFSIMLENHLGIEITDSRKRHLAKNYKAVDTYYHELQLQNPMSRIMTLEQIVSDVFKTYGREIDKIDEAIKAAAKVKILDKSHDVARGTGLEDAVLFPKTNRMLKNEFMVFICPQNDPGKILIAESSESAVKMVHRHQEFCKLPYMQNRNLNLTVYTTHKGYDKGLIVKDELLSYDSLNKLAYLEAHHSVLQHIKHTGEPLVLFTCSENSQIDDYTWMNLRDANNSIYNLNKEAATIGATGDRMDYELYYCREEDVKVFRGRYDIGFEEGKTITQSIERYLAGAESESVGLLKDWFAEYLDKHENLSTIEIMSRYTLEDVSNFQVNKDYAKELLVYVQEQRVKLNRNISTELSEIPELKCGNKDCKLEPSRAEVSMELRNHGYIYPTKAQVNSMMALNKMAIKHAGVPYSLEKVYAIYKGKEAAPSLEIKKAVEAVGEACRGYEKVKLMDVKVHMP